MCFLPYLFAIHEGKSAGGDCVQRVTKNRIHTNDNWKVTLTPNMHFPLWHKEAETVTRPISVMFTIVCPLVSPDKFFMPLHIICIVQLFATLIFVYVLGLDTKHKMILDY